MNRKYEIEEIKHIADRIGIIKDNLISIHLEDEREYAHIAFLMETATRSLKHVAFFIPSTHDKI